MPTEPGAQVAPADGLHSLPIFGKELLCRVF
jgi:hypothetical protein